MKIISSICLAALGVMAICNLAAAGDDEDFRTDINPALRYYQVMILGPEFPQADRDYLFTNEWRGQKLPARFGQLVSPHIFFDGLRKAGKATVPCDWGIDFSPGPATLLPHLGRCKTLAQLARLRVLWELQEGDAPDAQDDLIAAFALGRNSSRDGTLIAALVQFAIENIVLNTVAENFHSFTPDSLQQLAGGFDAAPALGTAAAAVRYGEKADFHDWLKRKILQWRTENAGNDAKVMASFHDMFRDLSPDPDFQHNWEDIQKAVKNSDGLLKMLADEDSYFERLARIMALPHPAFEEQALQFQSDLSKDPLMKLAFPSILKSRPKEFRTQAKLAMFHAAVAYKLHGRQGLQEVSDPFGNGPFHFERFVFEGRDRGFKLTSAYAGNGYPETLIFVEKKGKPFLCDGPKAGEPLPK